MFPRGQFTRSHFPRCYFMPGGGRRKRYGHRHQRAITEGRRQDAITGQGDEELVRKVLLWWEELDKALREAKKREKARHEGAIASAVSRKRNLIADIAARQGALFVPKRQLDTFEALMAQMRELAGDEELAREAMRLVLEEIGEEDLADVYIAMTAGDNA